MIVVIADDLTGAAEIGGIGLRYHFQVEITCQIEHTIGEGINLLVINTDTRSMTTDGAMKKLSKVFAWLKEIPYTYLFKKVDSVLRGYILAEIIQQKYVMGTKRALLLPANPRLGRTIRDGRYYVHGKAIHETNFSRDPEFPVRHADVLQMIGAQEEAQVKSWSDAFPEQGLVIGELLSEDDMRRWMQVVPDDVLLAGGSSAFIAFIEQHAVRLKIGKIRPTETFTGFKKPFLYISGSAYEQSTQRIKAWRMMNEPVCYLPIGRTWNGLAEQERNDWIERVKAAINCHGKAIIAFNNELMSSIDLNSGSLRQNMAKMVDNLLDEVYIPELVIEGGATAGAILAVRQIEKLKPMEALAPGLIRCRAYKDPEIWITLKPGSYDWYML